MPRDPLKFLEDMRLAGEAIVDFVRGRTLDAFRTDLMLRSAVERQFEILGEAVGQLRQCAPELANRMTDAARMVAFRNILIHRYFGVDDELVWQTATNHLPTTLQEVRQLIAELDSGGGAPGSA